VTLAIGFAVLIIPIIGNVAVGSLDGGFRIEFAVVTVGSVAGIALDGRLRIGFEVPTVGNVAALSLGCYSLTGFAVVIVGSAVAHAPDGQFRIGFAVVTLESGAGALLINCFQLALKFRQLSMDRCSLLLYILQLDL
jgi:hypothetical protein